MRNGFGTGRGRRTGRLLGGLAVVLLLAGCKVDLTVSVVSDVLGAGRISVNAELDRDATMAIAGTEESAPPPAKARLDLADLQRVGWSGSGLVRRPNGSSNFSLSHTFTTVTEANELLAQLSAADGPFGQLQLTRRRSPITTTVTLRGPGDFRRGLAAFGDANIAAVTGAGAFGLSEAEVARQMGTKTVADGFRVRLDADLVGTKRSWALVPGTTVPISASGQETSWATIAGAVAALGALGAFVALGSRRRGEDADAGAAPASAETSVVLATASSTATGGGPVPAAAIEHRDVAHLDSLDASAAAIPSTVAGADQGGAATTTTVDSSSTDGGE